jgi:exosortase F-associated protein
MQNEPKDYKRRILLLVLLVFLLIALRAFEDQLFYDPFLNYFKSDYTNLPLPIYDPFSLFLGLFLRYFLNSILSLGVIFVLFRSLEALKFCFFLYFVFFVMLTASFFFVLYFDGNHNNLLIFYIRRFLIQPLFLILFVPAFYYQKIRK